MIEAQAVVHRDPELVAALGRDLFERYGSATTGPEFLQAVRAQAAKRVALQFVPRRTTSWDHRKLGSAY
jgi:hypothetical protein